LETAGQCSDCIIAKGSENASRIQSKRPIRRKRGVGEKRRWREESKPAREVCFYVMRSAHRPDKSGEMLSEHPFPTAEASIS